MLLHHGEDFTFGTTDQRRVGQLLGVRRDQAVLLGQPLRLDELMSREGRRAVVADLAGADQSVEGGQRLQEISMRVGSVRLVEVQIVRAQSAQAVFDRLDDPAATVACVLRVVSNLVVELRRKEQVFARDRRRLQRLATISSDDP
jgi:hypothetical protein